MSPSFVGGTLPFRARPRQESPEDRGRARKALRPGPGAGGHQPVRVDPARERGLPGQRREARGGLGDPPAPRGHDPEGDPRGAANGADGDRPGRDPRLRPRRKDPRVRTDRARGIRRRPRPRARSRAREGHEGAPAVPVDRRPGRREDPALLAPREGPRARLERAAGPAAPRLRRRGPELRRVVPVRPGGDAPAVERRLRLAHRRAPAAAAARPGIVQGVPSPLRGLPAPAGLRVRPRGAEA